MQKRTIEARIRKLLDERDEGKTICPSEVARSLADDWEPLMEPVRQAAFAMPDVEITQHGKRIDGRAARGPIRLRRGSNL